MIINILLRQQIKQLYIQTIFIKRNIMSHGKFVWNLEKKKKKKRTSVTIIKIYIKPRI